MDEACIQQFDTPKNDTYIVCIENDNKFFRSKMAYICFYTNSLMFMKIFNFLNWINSLGRLYDIKLTNRQKIFLTDGSYHRS